MHNRGQLEREPTQTLLVCAMFDGHTSEADLARQFGVSRAAITLFRQRHQEDIDELYRRLYERMGIDFAQYRGGGYSRPLRKR